MNTQSTKLSMVCPKNVELGIEALSQHEIMEHSSWLVPLTLPYTQTRPLHTRDTSQALTS